jgi:hypothetical protein
MVVNATQLRSLNEIPFTAADAANKSINFFERRRLGEVNTFQRLAVHFRSNLSMKYPILARRVR